ncbi:SDR family NAD(P)-dependent oxidoreductase [Defluviimonas sp. D31]|uniref:SDR family NAD(P)-dependent oxidoreductase n=1 Tax=Defluviimonas sp. D31 TaxID=3083253 RepID=UPI00296EAD34|nr:SDR family NAD(P)-dependent oxidoreductase [Defluviimonas sp. D31]MDW4548406.1 SDR family NAD(P)-dependent oxidoreductase [Defluviimonas sp. D31]
MKKNVLISGAGTGLGRAASIALARNGHRVFATTFDEMQAEELKHFAASNALELESFKLDVTSEQDREQIRDIEIDVLINNAGIGYSGSIAEVDVELVRENFEVNVFAGIELTQLALKGMIARRRGSVIFISSIVGRMSVPFLGPYCMTKHAIEAAAEALRAEMDVLGANIQVALIEPGPYYTGFNQQIMGNKFSWMSQESYFYDQLDSLKAQDEDTLKELETTDLGTIVEKIVAAAEAKRPDLRYFAPEWLLRIVKDHEAEK